MIFATSDERLVVNAGKSLDAGRQILPSRPNRRVYFKFLESRQALVTNLHRRPPLSLLLNLCRTVGKKVSYQVAARLHVEVVLQANMLILESTWCCNLEAQQC